MKVRLFLLIPISLFAFGLVSLALVVASAQGINDSSALQASTMAEATPPPVAEPYIFSPSKPSPFITNPAGGYAGQPENLTHSQPDSLDERMRQQAMSASMSMSHDAFVPDGNEIIQLDQLAAVNRFEFWQSLSGRTWMWGEAITDSYVTVWLPREPYSMTAYADPNCNGCFGFPHVYLYPGDTIDVTTDDGSPPLVITIPDPYEAHADSLTGEVWGQIGGWISREVEVHNWWGQPMITTTTDSNGNFLVSLPGMPGEARGYIRFVDRPENTDIIFHRVYYDLQPVIAANFAHEWIEGHYEPGHTIWITLTNATGEVKATGSGVTDELPWWGGDTGWSVNHNVPLSVPWSSLDLEPGDWIYVRLDNGRTNELHLPEITGNIDVEYDVVSGNFIGEWLTGTVRGDCGVWGNIPNAPGMGFEAQPPDYSYTCDFASVPFDLLPGMEVGVGYREPDNDAVFNVFRQPAPHLWVNIWGEGTPASDTNYVLHVQFNNDGDDLAPGVLVTHTLWGMTYITDTSGLPHTGTGDPADPLVWQVGDLPPNWFTSTDFYVFVRVVNPPGSGLYADASIDTTLVYHQDDEERKYSAWGWDPVPEPNVEVNIGKNAWTGDPVPGNDFIYAVNSCNNGDTSSDWVVMTDTLPLSTTLVDWWGQNPGWVEVARSDHELVVTRPTLQDHWCSEVYLLVHLDESAWPGMQLHNVADVWSSIDWDAGNNHTEYWHSAGQPHPNLGLGSNWVYGTHVPGGSMGYEFYYYNNGNMPVEDAVVTTTLPAGTIFNYGYTWDNIGWRLYPPDLIVSPTLTQDGYAVWYTGYLMAGFQKNIGVWLDIDSDAEPGTPLNIQIDITRLPWEDRYNDNTLIFQEGVYEAGPNLRVDKHTNWNWEQWDQDDYLIGHELRIMNFGTEYLENVWITDTLPASSHLESWWRNHGPDPMYAYEQDGQVVFYVHHLNPGETASFGYRFRFDAGTVQQGMAFTDWMEAPIAGDVNPADNYDSVTAYSGPDVFVRKYLSGGIPKPGEIITFTVEFGNQTRWWNGDGNYPSLILDTLPEGMTFITATAPWTPDENWAPWLIVDDTLIWMWSAMRSESQWWYELVVQLDPELVGGQVLVNHIEAYGQSPNDIDPNGENNVFEYEVEVINPLFELAKTGEGSSVAGTTYTYTIEVANIGSELATNVTLEDTLPTGFIYQGSDGDYSSGVVTWLFTGIPPDGEAVSGWVSGNLECQAGTSIVNQEYLVTGSDQGVTSLNGPSFSLEIVEPAIQAMFDTSVTSIMPGETVNFTSTSTTDGTTLEFSWDFGDDQGGTGEIVSHTFDLPGGYEVSLTATDTCGYSDSYTATITVASMNIYLPIIQR